MVKKRVIATCVVASLLVGCDLRNQVEKARDQKPSVYTTGLSAKDLYQLREECSNSIPRLNKYGIDYQEHTDWYLPNYNIKLNRCFIAIGWHTDIPPPGEHFIDVRDAQTFERLFKGTKDEAVKSDVYQSLMESGEEMPLVKK